MACSAVVLKQMLCFIIIIHTQFLCCSASDNIFVINTWPFVDATEAAYDVLYNNGRAIDAVVSGCSQCEVDQCDGTVGWGGISPDEDGHTTLDAMVMEGENQDMGAVIQLKYVRDASKVARAVLEHTFHSILVGENATNFALSLGFERQNLSSQESLNVWRDWKENKCQPNYWKNMINSTKQCGPYQTENDVNTDLDQQRDQTVDQTNLRIKNEKDHDTIGMVALDKFGNMAAGTSTNGKSHKIAGRASDSALPGCGAYVDNEVGGALATGDGDIMMRFSPAFLAVELMRGGISPQTAADLAIKRISAKYPHFSGGVVTAARDGKFGAACNGMETFLYSYRNEISSGAVVVEISCQNEISYNDNNSNKTLVLLFSDDIISYKFFNLNNYSILFILCGTVLLSMIYFLYKSRHKDSKELGIKLIWTNTEELNS